MSRIAILVVAILLMLNRVGMAQTLSPASGQVTTVQDEKLNQLTEQYRKMSQNLSLIHI